MRDIPTPQPDNVESDIESAEDLHQQLAAVIAEAAKTGDFSKAEELQKQLETKLEPLKEEAERQDTPVARKERKIATNRKTLKGIYQRLRAGEELTSDNLRFLYQIDYEIEYRDLKHDPLISSILDRRDRRADIADLLGIDPKRVSLTKEEALSGDIIFHYGVLELYNATYTEGVTLPKTINGDLRFHNIVSAEGLTMPETLNGDLTLYLESAAGLTLPKIMNGDLILTSLRTPDGLVFPETVNGKLDLNNLTSAEGMTMPKTVNGDLRLFNLTSAEGLTLPETVNGCLDLYYLTSAVRLTMPKIVNGDLRLDALTSASETTMPETVNGDIELYNLTSAEGLTMPTTVDGGLDLSGLLSIEGLTLPETVRRGVNLGRGVTQVERDSLRQKYPQLNIF